MKYFAYGSNMLISRLQERVSSAVFAERVVLKGYDIVFDKVGSFCGTGKCGIVPSDDKNACVYGVVFDMDEAELPDLDYYEGLGNGYEREVITVHSLSDSEKPIQAVSYIPTVRDPTVKPFDWYNALVIAGLKQHDFPLEYISGLEQVETTEDSDKERAEKHWKLMREFSSD